MGGSLTEEEITSLTQTFQTLSQLLIFIETGTYKGVTTRLASKFFKDVYTFEICEPLHLEAVDSAKKENISTKNYLLGDSVKLLEKVLNEDKRPAFFFLDAHMSGSDSSYNGDELVPVLTELKLINNLYTKQPAVICVDDHRLFSKYDDWKNVSLNSIKNCLSNHEISYDFVKNDRYYLILNL